MGYWKRIILPLMAASLLFAIVFAKDEKQETKEEILTVYDNNGRATFQSETNKGWHRVMGSIVLVAGVATVTLNTSTTIGKQDVSFQAQTSYGGYAWSLNLSDLSNRYTVWPRTGMSFRVTSSDATDTREIYYLVEGQ